jgi:amino acid transporter
VTLTKTQRAGITSNQAKADEATLVRGLGLIETTALVIGGIIGASIFAVPAAAAREVGAPGLALLHKLLPSLVGITLMFLALPFYLYWNRKKEAARVS